VSGHPKRPGPWSSLILETGARAIFHTILVYSLYLLFAGHNRPGGGFVGGLTAGTALVLIFAALGPDGLRKAVRFRPERLLGAGLLAAAATGVGPLVAGREFLTHGYAEFSVPLLGHVAITSALVFDTGVYAIVVGLVLAILTTIGSETPS
jgi:multisubunit Na+/H+ antiporter MnhB subunit